MKALALALVMAMTPSTDKARADRVARLTADDGWLTLVGLAWLSQGKQTVGRAGGNTIVVDSANAAEHMGTLEVNGSSITFNDGSKTVPMVSDAAGKPTVITQGSVSFFVIDRGGKLGLRVKDAKAPTRTSFGGLKYFPDDPSWRVDATFEPAAVPQKVRVPTVAGVDEEHVIPGVVHFTHGKDDVKLQVLDDDGELMIVFADATSGKETYGAARFLYAKKPVKGHTTLDFNLAENPPCAFTPYATCPLPPAGNRLAIRVEAGELAPAGHH
jgi:uncharacterized protein (DUF1684 family)